MAKVLKALPQELDVILAMTQRIDPALPRDGAKVSRFRRALQLAVAQYTKDTTEIAVPYRKDYNELYVQETAKAKALAEAEPDKKDAIQKEIDEIKTKEKVIQTEVDAKIAEYRAIQKETKVKFDNEDFLHVSDLFSRSSQYLFGMFVKDKDGNIKQAAYNDKLADEFFVLLDKAQ